MLDTETKRRIDACRDILVGKVPDPKSQVEQITIALIYKFMDDMDAQAEELGGKRSFFVNGFQRFSWSKLLAAGMGGQDTLNLYSEAIGKMTENTHLPELFRDIFKNAYLPYRDPETLRSFLKEIDHFEYSHSEKLGDAFEYLLSVLGSQGDAGQFRTPRHIIDFMVEVIAPQKHERILDPACGTAGFLISAWKYIQSHNQKNHPGDLLTPSERAKLAANIHGYDISPDMVRLSLVNLYLHGFTQPNVEEYDTLTSEDKWNEQADVILANPPFMSPKGGIKPHKRFSVQATRSEVLFVDYMAEHLSATGRAAIVVPEGIIFQSGTAYKALRKMLLDTSLVAVVSLPAGVFNPYSGVKTSILVMDKRVHKQTDKVLFVKVQNDGFNLGAQRRAVANSDLPEATRLLRNWLTAPEAFEGDSVLAQVVTRERIGASGDFNLSGERYVAALVHATDWPLLPLCEIAEFRSGLWKGEKQPLRTVKILRNTNFAKGGFLNLSDVAEHPVEERQLESRLLRYGDILLEKSGGGPTQPVGRVAFFGLREGEYSYSNFTARIRVVNDQANPAFVWLMLNAIYQRGDTEGLQKQTSGIRNLDNPAYQALQLPLPPLEVQHQIVAEIEGYQKIIDGARQVIDNYVPRIPIDLAWSPHELGSLCHDFSNGANFSAEQVGRGTKFINIKDVFSDGYVNLDRLSLVELSPIEIARKKVEPDDLLFVRSSVKESGVGYPSLVPITDETVVFCGFLIKCSPIKEVVIPGYLLWLLRTPDFREKVVSRSNRANITNISQDALKTLPIPLPDLETQRAIVAEIEAEQTLVNANRELIARMEAKIKAAMDRVWGKSSEKSG
jgi:type I restriction enzyme M protein